MAKNGMAQGGNRGGTGGATRLHTPRDLYQEVTDRVVAALEAGTPPWRRPWDVDKAITSAGATGPAMPRNAVTGAGYRGINVLVLGLSALALGGGDPRWATYRQAAERGWQVRRGEQGTTACLFKRIEVRDGTAGPDDEEATRRIPLLRAFTLFHASQIEGIPDYVPPTVAEAPWRAPEAAEVIVANSGAVVRTGGTRAFYAPGTDHIQMPPREAFRTAAGWSGVMMHEMAHWTGHEDRLDRDLRHRFGTPDYAREELRAELAQAMVCAELGIGECDFTNNAAYVACWLETFRSDRKEAFRAAADAQRIADHLLAFHSAHAASRAAALAQDEPEAASTNAATVPAVAA